MACVRYSAGLKTYRSVDNVKLLQYFQILLPEGFARVMPFLIRDVVDHSCQSGMRIGKSAAAPPKPPAPRTKLKRR